MGEFKLKRIRRVFIFPIEELALPDFEIYQRPEPFGMVLSTSLMSFDQATNEGRIEKTAAHRAFA